HSPFGCNKMGRRRFFCANVPVDEDFAMTYEVSSVRRTRRTPFALRPIALAAVTLTLAACGGGGGSDTDPPPPPGPGPAPVVPQSISGTVVDGYLADATVNCRKGGTLVATTTSNASGGYAFNLASGQTCDNIDASDGINVRVPADDPSDAGAAPATSPAPGSSVARAARWWPRPRATRLAATRSISPPARPATPSRHRAGSTSA